MRSLQFPKIFNSTSTNVWKASDYKKQTAQNLKLLLQTEKGELFGDPYFGIQLKRYTFDQNSYILKDILIDEIYTQIALFIPQLRVERKDITIVQDKQKGALYCNIKGINQIDYTVDTYSLQLYNEK